MSTNRVTTFENYARQRENWNSGADYLRTVTESSDLRKNLVLSTKGGLNLVLHKITEMKDSEVVIVFTHILRVLLCFSNAL